MRLIAGFRHRLVDAGLIRAEGSAALENQGDLLVYSLSDRREGDFLFIGRVLRRGGCRSVPGDRFRRGGIASRGKRPTMP